MFSNIWLPCENRKAPLAAESSPMYGSKSESSLYPNGGGGGGMAGDLSGERKVSKYWGSESCTSNSSLDDGSSLETIDNKKLFFNNNNFRFLSSDSFSSKMSYNDEETIEMTKIRPVSDEEDERVYSPTPLISMPPENENCDRTMKSVVQRNGQRIYGGPPHGWDGPPPPKGTEIFVGKLPRDVYENELVPLFSKCGRIYELRLMMDFSGSNRGYLFVLYSNKEEAKRAVKELNNYEIRPNKKIGVVKSVDNRKLWISGIPKNRTAEEIRTEMEKQTEGVTGVVLYSSQMDKTKTRGYAFIEYETHRAAALARRKLVPGRVFIFDHEIEKVDWAEPENDVDEEIMQKVRILFVRNLSPHTSEAKLNEYFENILDGEKLERVKKTKDYAFVHFLSRESAELAFSRCVNATLDGSLLDIGWSKPVDKNIYNARKEITKALTNPPPYPYEQLPLTNCSNISCQSGGGGGPGTLPPRALMQRFVGRAINGNVPPQQPKYITPKAITSHVEALRMLCDRNRWGKPIYNTMGNKTPSNEAMLYTCKLTIPQYPIPHPANVFQSMSLKPTEEEAKNDVAQIVLSNLELDFRKQAALTAATFTNGNAYHPYDPQMVMAAFAAAASSVHHPMANLYLPGASSPVSSGGTPTPPPGPGPTYAIQYPNYNQYHYGRYGGPPPPYGGLVNEQLTNSLYNMSLNSQ